MSVLITMRVKVHDFEGTRKAAVLFAETPKKAGCHWAKVYRSEQVPNDVLPSPSPAPQDKCRTAVALLAARTVWLMEWESHNAFNKSGDESGEQFNKLVNPAGEWDDVVWHLSDARTVE